jgi:hypothetical protein
VAVTVYPWGSPVFSASNYYPVAMGDANSAPPVAAIAGNVSATNGSANIVGTSTAFTTALQVGQFVQIHADTTGKVYTIASITDDTHLALTGNYTGTTNASTTLTQNVQNAIAALDLFPHAGFQVVGSSFGVGYMVKTGTAPTLEYSTDGVTFSTVGTLTVDARFHVATVSLGSDATYNVWLRLTGSTAADNFVFNGDQFITVTGASPALNAVASSSNAPGGSGMSSVSLAQCGNAVEVLGNCRVQIFGLSKSPWVVVGNTDFKLRLQAQCTEIWMLAYSTASTQAFLLSVDGVPTGSGPSAIGKVSTVANSKLWWYKIAGSLDGTAIHEYVINAMIGSGTWIAAVAVAGTFNPRLPPRSGLCWMNGDSILTSFNNYTEGFGWDVGRLGYNVINQGVFGALVQTQYQWSPWPIVNEMSSPVSPAGFSGHMVPDLIIAEGGYNDAVHDGSTSATPITDAIHSRTNFRATLQAYLANLRAIAPFAPIRYINIPPAGSSGPSLRTSYNADIATVISALADPNTMLIDVSSISGYNVCNTNATVTATISGGSVTGFTGLVGGSGYTPSATINVGIRGGTTGTAATAHATTNGSGVVTSVTLDSGGSGYTVAPNVAIGDTYDTIHPNANGYDKLWAVISPYIPTFSPGGPFGAFMSMP